MFEIFLFHRWSKNIIRIINGIIGVILWLFLAFKFKNYNAYKLSSIHKDYRIDGTFLPYVFFFILIYFYFLFTEWLIKKLTTYKVNQTQLLQAFQEKKLVVEGHEYQVEKIDKLKISFYPQNVNFQGILLVPQEGSYLKLDFSANTSLDYYNQHLIGPLQGISKRIGKKSFSLVWIFFHSTLLTFFFIYLFIITPRIMGEAQRRNWAAMTDNRSKSSESTDVQEEKKEDYYQKLQTGSFPSKVKENLLKEISRLNRMGPYSSNRDVQEEYVEKLMSLPWWRTTEENKDLAAVQTELDKGHFGLEKVKERVIEYLAGEQRTDGKQSRVLCLVGPPGTGKTSLSYSIARATGRKFAKVSVGGVSDEGEIRGHRRTYVGALPGRIVQAINQAGVVNPLLLIDEIDKVFDNVAGRHGNPVAALLEVLDPEQNEKFNDAYLGQDFPYDLSRVFFVCTANVLEHIPRPLRDRMDVIQLPPYTTFDKIQIAKNHTIPEILAKYKLEKDQLTFTDEAIEEIISFYIESGGLRDTKRIFKAIADKFAVKQILNNLKNEKIDLVKLREYLGVRKIEPSDLVNYDQPGIVNGLAWTEVGGDVLSIEVNCFPGKGNLKLTGNLGETMRESAQVALSYIRANYQEFGIDYHLFTDYDVCIHVPHGGIPKDGPSAGITLTTTIISALTKKTIPSHIAMTGEITSKGKVSPIGGLREKLTAAYEHKLRTIFIPRGNKSNLSDLPSQIKDKLEIIPVNNYLQIWDKIKDKSRVSHLQRANK